MTDIIWETPPPAASTGRKPSPEQAAFAAALRERPQSWARLPKAFPNKSTASNTAVSIRAGRLVAFRPHGAFEAEQRVVDGAPTVYVRYVGGAK